MRSTAAGTILLALICFASVEGKSVCHEEDGAEGVLYYKQHEEEVLENHKYLKLTIRTPLKSEDTEGNEETEANEDTEGRKTQKERKTKRFKSVSGQILRRKEKIARRITMNRNSLGT